jgi:hypothetical protein
MNFGKHFPKTMVEETWGEKRKFQMGPKETGMNRPSIWRVN